MVEIKDKELSRLQDKYDKLFISNCLFYIGTGTGKTDHGSKVAERKINQLVEEKERDKKRHIAN